MRRLQKTIQSIGWTEAVPRLTDRDPVSHAFDVMSREAHDCVLVMHGTTLAGIFTSRDFLDRIAAPRRDPRTIPLSEVMTPNPRTLRPRDGIAFAINWMAVEGFRNVPIVDDLDQVLGVLTVFDVMRHLDDIFDEIESTPRESLPMGDLDAMDEMVDLGGMQ